MYFLTSPKVGTFVFLIGEMSNCTPGVLWRLEVPAWLLHMIQICEWNSTGECGLYSFWYWCNRVEGRRDFSGLQRPAGPLLFDCIAPAQSASWLPEYEQWNWANSSWTTSSKFLKIPQSCWFVHSELLCASGKWLAINVLERESIQHQIGTRLFAKLRTHLFHAGNNSLLH